MLEGPMVQDHAPMLLQISPKYSVAEMVGHLKGKSAIAAA
ncbi:MAG: transposase [Gammaproteobacteria bacterium]